MICAAQVYIQSLIHELMLYNTICIWNNIIYFSYIYWQVNSKCLLQSCILQIIHNAHSFHSNAITKSNT